MSEMVERVARLKRDLSLEVTRAEFAAYLHSLPPHFRFVNEKFDRWPHLICDGVLVYPLDADRCTEAEWLKREGWKVEYGLDEATQ